MRKQEMGHGRVPYSSHTYYRPYVVIISSSSKRIVMRVVSHIDQDGTIHYLGGDFKKPINPDLIETVAEQRGIHPDKLAEQALEKMNSFKFLGRNCKLSALQSGVIVLLPE